jgi:hypothetical protein
LGLIIGLVASVFLLEHAFSKPINRLDTFSDRVLDRCVWRPMRPARICLTPSARMEGDTHLRYLMGNVGGTKV